MLQSELGGDKRDRTADPLLARQVLSQLSYTPMASKQASYLSFPSLRKLIHSTVSPLPRKPASLGFARILGYVSFSGGPKWTRTTDLTIISRAL